MDGTAVKAISDLAQVQILPVGGQDFSSKPLHIPPPDPYAAPLQFFTLSGLLNHLKFEGHKDVFVHVKSAEEVLVVGKMDDSRFHVRVVYGCAMFPGHEAMTARFMGHGFGWGQYYPVETAIIALQSLFQATPDRDTLLKLLSSVRDEAVRSADDDGMAQVVSTRAGVVLAATAKIPTPVTLAPFRTFPEIVNQPTSAFVVRAKGGSERDKPQFALFLADGGAWHLEAVKAIQAWLVSYASSIALTGVQIIA